MGLGKFPHPSLYMGIPVVSYCCHGDGSEEFISDGIYPLPTLPPLDQDPPFPFNTVMATIHASTNQTLIMMTSKAPPVAAVAND